jgi:hypothetical protein
MGNGVCALGADFPDRATRLLPFAQEVLAAQPSFFALNNSSNTMFSVGDYPTCEESSCEGDTYSITGSSNPTAKIFRDGDSQLPSCRNGSLI